jgi:23S rRNA (pseudouridine1915-N3)-methyltransferase
MNPSRCRIIAIGKVRKTWVQEGIELYLKRLPGLTIVELRDGNPEKEAESIRQTLRSDEWPVMLMEQGETLTSISFSERLRNLGSQRLAFVIGGTDGLTAELKGLAHWKLSLSPMTFPHELARLLLIEQLFRAQAIQQGSPYHRA